MRGNLTYLSIGAVISVGFALLFMVPFANDSISSIVSGTGHSAYGQLGLNPVPTTEEVIATYIARIPPGAALKVSPIHKRCAR